MNYTAIRNKLGKVICVQSDAGFIPLDPRNGDYATFLAWNAAQSVPLDLSDKAPDAPTAEESAVNADRVTLRAIKQKLRSNQTLTTQDRQDALQAIIGLIGS